LEAPDAANRLARMELTVRITHMQAMVSASTRVIAKKDIKHCQKGIDPGKYENKEEAQGLRK
jgi:hypothetical protein